MTSLASSAAAAVSACATSSARAIPSDKWRADVCDPTTSITAFYSLKINQASARAPTRFRSRKREQRHTLRMTSSGVRKIVRCKMSGTDTEPSGSGGGIVREVLTRQGRSKLDVGSDRDFYAFPRLVTHVDDSFLRTLTQLYRDRLPPGGTVLDLMSSWVSHLPPDEKYSRVIGHGMNGAELAKNRRLDEFFVKDLNDDQQFAIASSSLDAVICAVSVQYMQQPEKVFSEIYRMLKPGGVCVMSFSNRMFYDKAVASWRETSGYGRVSLVKQYFQCVTGFTQAEVVTELPSAKGERSVLGSNLPGPLKFLGNVAKLMQRSGSDPFYAVVAYRNFKPL